MTIALNSMKIDIDKLLSLAKEAGNAILDVYNGPLQNFDITLKDDKSPLTMADRISHEIILKGLKKIKPSFPVLSEEGSNIPYEVRKNWDYYWCVDPLDGTKEFISRNGEFTVNIALIHDGHPILGVIYIPVQDTLYYGEPETGSWKISNGVPEQIKADSGASAWISVGSRSHSSPEEEAFLSAFPIVNSVSAGSSLKFCMIAEGKAHVYYRKGPTMEWDTAAGHAIATLAGAAMTTPEGNPFKYNKPSLLNGSFLCKTN
ncbi:3'(2'),5'-bisphosphate nucleotidase [Arcticibacter tournemirensis]|nr:3'(2'),5'-bisphosphate nucleotidase [Arcticibacter tournemirensis]